MNPSSDHGANSHHESLNAIPARRYIGWWVIGLATVAMVLLWAAGDTAQLWLRYERQPILDGQWWRLITGHWVHGGLRHMALNVLGTWVIAALFVRTYSPIEWLCIVGVSTLTIDGGFLMFEPQLNWYVGASGVLHGALAAGAIAWWRTEPKIMASVLTMIVVGKLGWEQSQGALPLAGSMPVIVDAHLYGAIGGALTAIVLEWRKYRRSTRTKAPL